jgi:hypothetical protein
MHYVPGFRHTCLHGFLLAEAEPLHAACPRCAHDAVALRGPQLEAADRRWFERLVESTTMDPASIQAITIDILQMLLRTPEAPREDVVYLLRHVALLETVELPSRPEQIRRALLVLAALVEEAQRGEEPASKDAASRRQARRGARRLGG